MLNSEFSTEEGEEIGGGGLRWGWFFGFSKMLVFYASA